MLAFDVLGRSLEILAGGAVKQGKEYTSNIAQLVTDANEIKGTITSGAKTALDTYRQIKNRSGGITKAAMNWFFQRSNDFGQFDLMDGNVDDDFDPGFRDDSSPDEESEAPSIIDQKSMKNIARGQVAAMYQIGGKQVEANLANTAEIVSSLNSRSCEIITSINNMNSTLLKINQQIAGLTQSIAGSKDEERSDYNNNRKSIRDGSGKIGLSSFFNTSLQSLKENPHVGFLSTVAGMFKMRMNPSDMVQMLIFDKLFDEIKIGDKSVNQIGNTFNTAIGNIVNEAFSRIIESNAYKKIFGDLTKGYRVDYSDYYDRNDYTTEKAVFDKMTRKSIIDVIPNYLKKITEALTGINYNVDNKGNLTTKELDMFTETNKRFMRSNPLIGTQTSKDINQRIADDSLTYAGVDEKVINELEKMFAVAYVGVMFNKGIRGFSTKVAYSLKDEVIPVVVQMWKRKYGETNQLSDTVIDATINMIFSEIFSDVDTISQIKSGSFVQSINSLWQEMDKKDIAFGQGQYGYQAKEINSDVLTELFADTTRSVFRAQSHTDLSGSSQEKMRAQLYTGLREAVAKEKSKSRRDYDKITEQSSIEDILTAVSNTSNSNIEQAVKSLYRELLDDMFEKEHDRSAQESAASSVTRGGFEEGQTMGSLVTSIWKKLSEGVINVRVVHESPTGNGNFPSMNMNSRGCGPTALADLFNRKNGLDPESLAQNMYAAGLYNPDAGTNVRDYILAARGMGMNLYPGIVTGNALKTASPYHPITLLGSGYGFGTKHGNLHYMNIIGSSGSSVYTSNPMYGGIRSFPSSIISGNSILGLYGSGDSDEKTESLVRSIEDAIDGKTEDLKAKLVDPENQSILVQILREGGIDEEDISNVAEIIKRGGFEKALKLPGVLGITRKISATTQAMKEHATKATDRVNKSLNEEIGAIKDDVRTAFRNRSEYRHRRREDVRQGKAFAESRKETIESTLNPRDREYANEALQMMQAALADGDGKKDLSQIIRVVNRIQDKALRQDLSMNISRLIRNSAEKTNEPAKSKLGKILFWGWGLIKKVLTPIKTAVMAVGTFFLRNSKSILKFMARPFVQSAGWIASGVKDVKEGLFGRKEKIDGKSVTVEKGIIGATADVIKHIFRKIGDDPAVKSAMDVFNNARKMFGTIGRWFKTMPKVIFGAIKGTVKVVSNYLMEHSNTILHFLIFNPLKFIGNSFKHVIIDPLSKGIKNLGKGVASVAKFIGNSFKHVIFDTVKNGFDKLRQKLQGDEKKQKLREAQRKRREAKKEHLKNIKEAVKREEQEKKERKREEKERKREERLDRIRNKQDTIGDRLGYIFDTLGSKLKELTTGLFNDIKKYGGDLFKGIGDVAKNLPGFLGRAAGGIITGTVRGSVDMTKGFFGGIKKSHAAGKEMANSFLKSALGYDKKAADMKASTLADQKAKEIMEFIRDPNSILNKNISDILRELILVREGDETARKEAKEAKEKEAQEAKEKEAKENEVNRVESAEKIDTTNDKNFGGKSQEKVGKDQSSNTGGSQYTMFSDSMRSNSERDISSASNKSDNDVKSNDNTTKNDASKSNDNTKDPDNKKPMSAAGKLGAVLGKSLNGMFKIVAGIGTMLASAIMEMKIISTIGKTVTRMIKSIVAPLAKTISKLWTAIKPVLRVVKDCLRSIVSQVGELIEGLVVTLQPVFDIIADLLPSLVQLLSDTLIPIIKWIAETALAILVPVIDKVIAPALKVIIGIIGVISSGITGIIKWLGQNLLAPILLFFDDWRSLLGGLSKEKRAERAAAIDKLTHVYDTWKENDTSMSYYGDLVKTGISEFGRGTQEDKKSNVIDTSAVDVGDKFINNTSGGSVMEGNIAPSVINNNTDSSSVNNVDSSSNETVINETGSGDTTNIYNTYGSGMGSQYSYGSYMNMRDHGCGPVALADRYARTTGSKVSPVALARSMRASGNYDSNRGTTVGSFVNMGRSMGMNMTVGGVNDRSLRQATPNNPITVIGSGGAFGTRRGNTHYMNVVGSDGNGHAYVANPIRGGISKVSISDISTHSIAGLYGSGENDNNDWSGGSGTVNNTGYYKKYQEWASQYKSPNESEEAAKERFKQIYEADSQNKKAEAELKDNKKEKIEGEFTAVKDILIGTFPKKFAAFNHFINNPDETYGGDPNIISTDMINAIVGDDDYTSLPTGRTVAYDSSKNSKSLTGGMQSVDEISSTDPTVLSSVYGFSDKITELMDGLKTLSENFLAMFTGQTGADAAMSKKTQSLEKSAILDGLTSEQRESLESDAYELWKSENEKLSTETDLQYEQRWRREREKYIMRVAETELGVNAKLEGISRENIKTAAGEYSDAMKSVMDSSSYIDALYQSAQANGTSQSGTGSRTAINFTPRLTKPDTGNKFYNSPSAGYNTIGNIPPGSISGLNVLPNCSGYALGRFHEEINDPSFKYFQRKYGSRNGHMWVENARNAGNLEIDEKGVDPHPGDAVSWVGGNNGGHVAIVEQVLDPDTIVISHSGYKSFTFKTDTVKRGNASDPWKVWSNYRLKGFIHNPEIQMGAANSGTYTSSDGTPEGTTYAYLVGSKGMTPIGAAGAMGCIKYESNFQSNNLENKFQSMFGYGSDVAGDERYTAAVNNRQESESQFVTGRGRPNKVGYGLTQFTSSNLKQELYNNTVKQGKPIDDIPSQLDCVVQTLKSSTYNGDSLFNKMNQSKTPTDANKLFLWRYEAGTSYQSDEAVAKAYPWMGMKGINDRHNAAEEYYKKYSATNPSLIPINSDTAFSYGDYGSDDFYYDTDTLESRNATSNSGSNNNSTSKITTPKSNGIGSLLENTLGTYRSVNTAGWSDAQFNAFMSSHPDAYATYDYKAGGNNRHIYYDFETNGLRNHIVAMAKSEEKQYSSSSKSKSSKSNYWGLPGSGDSPSLYIPPINDSMMNDYFNGSMFDTAPQTTNNYYIARDEGDSIRDHLTELLNHTFDVRSESIEAILTEMLNEIKSRKNSNTPKQPQPQPQQDLFDNNRIPSQIEKLLVGKTYL